MPHGDPPRAATGRLCEVGPIGPGAAQTGGVAPPSHLPGVLPVFCTSPYLYDALAMRRAQAASEDCSAVLNWPVSVEPAIAVVEDAPPEIARLTASK